jgi:hypothetical protein
MANKESVAVVRDKVAAENATADKEMEDKMVVVGGKVAVNAANAANAARDVEDKKAAKAANAANAAEDTRDLIDCRRTYLVL